jgi:hypothetical protein
VKRIIYLASALALLPLACGEEGVTPLEPDRLEPATPANVLRNVELSFDNRDIGLFKATLSNGFVFYFDPRKVGQLPRGGRTPIPESWNYSEIVQWVSDLFEKAYFISLHIEAGKVGRPEPEENTYLADNIKVTLIVKMNELEGYTYDGYGNVEFEKYAAANGEDYWRIKYWWDRAGPGFGGYPASPPPSLGAALAAF